MTARTATSPARSTTMAHGERAQRAMNVDNGQLVIAD
jgi:hypothetical protein